ncbi:PrgI family protein [Candidatus Azambacteria bacterium]|nr:PrgI family protein [Candidatus Azambacteria bacterium]
MPQFIEAEDRIIGPLTLKQFLYLAFAGAILFVLWFIFNLYVWIIVAVPVIAIAVAFAFLKINDRPFVYFFLAFLRYFTKPRLYLFSSAPEKAAEPEKIEKKIQPQAPAPQEEKITPSKLKELALKLDTGTK